MCFKRKEKKKERKKVNQSKIGEKKKRKKIINTEIFSLYLTMPKQRVALSKAKRREIVTITWLKPEGCMKQSPS